MSKTRILVADGTDIVKYGVRAILKKEKNFEIVGVADCGEDACALFATHNPDVCIISSNISDLNIHEIMEKFRKISKNVRVLVLTNSTEFIHLNQALKAGVTGYVVKSTSGGNLIEAVKSVANGEQTFSASVSRMITKRYTDLAQKKEDQKTSQLITKREHEILQLIVDGYTSSEIANLLYISPRTVETHRSNLMQKLNIRNTAGLVRYALEKGETK
ncbi:MAG: LuxR C-terminal-related transcriptional regulator [Balneolaceae bacterium]